MGVKYCQWLFIRTWFCIHYASKTTDAWPVHKVTLSLGYCTMIQKFSKGSFIKRFIETRNEVCPWVVSFHWSCSKNFTCILDAHFIQCKFRWLWLEKISNSEEYSKPFERFNSADVYQFKLKNGKVFLVSLFLTLHIALVFA